MSPTTPGNPGNPGNTMTLFIGSLHDGIRFPVPDTASALTVIVEDPGGQELARGTYTRRTIGTQSVMAIQAMTNAAVLERLLAGYDRERVDA